MQNVNRLKNLTNFHFNFLLPHIVKNASCLSIMQLTKTKVCKTVTFCNLRK